MSVTEWQFWLGVIAILLGVCLIAKSVAEIIKMPRLYRRVREPRGKPYERRNLTLHSYLKLSALAYWLARHQTNQTTTRTKR